MTRLHKFDHHLDKYPTMRIIFKSEYMRNGDYLQTRFEAQADALNIVFQTKIDSNAKSTVGTMTTERGMWTFVFDSYYFCYALVFFFLSRTRRFMLLVRRIWGKFSTVFILLAAGKIGGYIDGYRCCTVYSQASRKLEPSSTHHRICCFTWTVRERMARSTKRLKKNNVEMG